MKQDEQREREIGAKLDRLIAEVVECAMRVVECTVSPASLAAGTGEG